ncbi:hypothetical protein BEQ56_04965 [Anaerolineaceae bacterium oral taxon 439]|nr:hypothetical protein BEQ56_04965 [Anaerolineaceae bacterium oral taxon 439]
MFNKDSKKFTIVFLALAAALAFASAALAADPIKVVTTNFPGYDFVRAVGGDLVQVKMLLPPGAESHSFEPTPKDMIEIQQAGLFVATGGENEEWVERILESFGESAPKTVRMIEMVDAVPEEIVEGMEHDHDHDDHDAHDDHDHDDHDDHDVHDDRDHDAHDDHDDHDRHDDHDHDTHDDHDHDRHDDHDHDTHDDHDHDHEIELDEHVWTSPRNAMIIVNKLGKTLSELDPANADVYAANAGAYAAKLADLDKEYKDLVAGAVRKTIIVGDRFPLRYLADAYGLNYFAAFTGCSTDTEASAGTIAFLIDEVKEHQIPIVFYIEFSNQKIANAIAEATGAKTREIHSAHNVSKQDFESGVTYYDLMKKNLIVLKEALY